MELDGSLRAVELTLADAEAVTELVRACELEDGGIDLHLERRLR